MKRASYREAIAWIADNDSGGVHDALEPERVAELITSVLVADIFDVECIKVGQDVVRYRERKAAFIKKVFEKLEENPK